MIEQLKKEIEETKKDNVDAPLHTNEEKLKELEEQTSKLQNTYDITQKRNEELEKENTEMRRIIDELNLKEENDKKIKEENIQKDKEIEEMKQKNKEVEDMINNEKEKTKRMEEEINKMKRIIEKKEIEEKTFKRMKEETEKKMKEEVSQKEKRINELERKIEIFQIENIELVQRRLKEKREMIWMNQIVSKKEIKTTEKEEEETSKYKEEVTEVRFIQSVIPFKVIERKERENVDIIGMKGMNLIVENRKEFKIIERNGEENERISIEKLNGQYICSCLSLEQKEIMFCMKEGIYSKIYFCDLNKKEIESTNCSSPGRIISCTPLDEYNYIFVEQNSYTIVNAFKKNLTSYISYSANNIIKLLTYNGAIYYISEINDSQKLVIVKGSNKTFISLDKNVISMDVGYQCLFLITSSSLYCFDINTKQFVNELSLTHFNSPRIIATSHNHRVVAIGCCNDDIVFWNAFIMDTTKSVKQFTLNPLLVNSKRPEITKIIWNEQGNACSVSCGFQIFIASNDN
ncbi:hypothetical protein ENUP19_0050G0049 [Entamoeba nuttalli]|uniref:Meiosis-specific nuclear structural protein n=2 Tax=Entamoeba nuttalli TaxID=412467 RepID=K2GGK0_ENTNP|nr:hypothetical protein ENU1_040640 [Entamoeba nuttalli P19]EKE41896.1 hypothetical protein ENU1_040640 [Entamoeba nuttalli P19]|eukprot:XP_008855760.1 hypothetical protein ENU1_040640 [Entamoeba nuttalli P19]